MDLTEPVRQNSSLLNHLATADPTLPGSQRDARMSSDEIPAVRACGYAPAINSLAGEDLLMPVLMLRQICGKSVCPSLKKCVLMPLPLIGFTV